MLVFATPYEGYFLCSTFLAQLTTSSMETMYLDLNRVFMFTTYKSLNMDFDSSCLCMEFCGWYAFMTHTQYHPSATHMLWKLSNNGLPTILPPIALARLFC